MKNSDKVRVNELAEHYPNRLPTLTGTPAELSVKVAVHLNKMGFRI